MEIGIALPKGRLLEFTSSLLAKAGWELSDYRDKARLYRLKSGRYPGLCAKMFHEKDIPIQVAIGNYDLGICGSDWLEEQLARFPGSALVKLKDLGYGEGGVFVAAAAASLASGALTTRNGRVRIASEYPNLAEKLAEDLNLSRFSIYPLWGAAEGYPPENAELVLLSRRSEAEVRQGGLTPLGRLVDFRACLVANAASLRSKDMAGLLATVESNLPQVVKPSEPVNIVNPIRVISGRFTRDEDAVSLALPDGHQQAHVRKILDGAGINIEGYPSTTGDRRPQGLAGFFIKVIRPQDMPLQVANGNFDLAITGRDWLTDHLYQFPTSPVKEMMDLKYGWVRIVAVVDNSVPANTTAELRELRQEAASYYRVASEYVNIADYFARVNRLGQYRVIPTWGATEAFLPEDADLLIENTETGSTIARHNLKIIDTLFESTACVIGREQPVSPLKQGRINGFLDALRGGLGAMS